MFGGTTGVIEGFYGPPWSWDQRRDVAAWCAERGMTRYVYAPKDDPLHRERWREPYPDDELAAFERFAAAGTLRLGFAISPGLSMDDADAGDRAALLAKVDQVVAVGADLVVLALDDIPAAPGQGTRHGRLTAWLAEHLAGRAEVVLVPTDYTSTRPVPYLTDLAATCPREVPIAWTGPTVVCDQITVADAEARADALGGRPPFVWDNYPCNDTVMADRLFLGPLRGRAPGLAGVTSGWLANPMVQPTASTLPLASVAAFLRGEDPEAAWAAEADRLGVRALAEACDGERPQALVDSVLRAATRSSWEDALAALHRWLEAVRAVEPAVLGGEVEPWRSAARAEARVCLQAVRLLEVARGASGVRTAGGGGGLAETSEVAPPGGDPGEVDGGTGAPPGVAVDEGVGTGEQHGGPGAHDEGGPGLADASRERHRRLAEGALGLAMGAQALRREVHSTFGPRNSMRPVLSQHDDGEWHVHAASAQVGPNATDALVAYALGVVDAEA